jgi:hypothetical protein
MWKVSRDFCRGDLNDGECATEDTEGDGVEGHNPHTNCPKGKSNGGDG